VISADIAQIGVHPDDIPLVYEAAARGVETRSDYEDTHRIVMPDGRIKFLHVMARATRDFEGRLEYIFSRVFIPEPFGTGPSLNVADADIAKLLEYKDALLTQRERRAPHSGRTPQAHPRNIRPPAGKDARSDVVSSGSRKARLLQGRAGKLRSA
jgi:hypothetical protein